ncbi:MAG: hypothetical protein KTR16_05695 [Acidiferrobacterales bacterium]|nr:hypothetical protein [Acidiferrobacterales bacterium]
MPNRKHLIEINIAGLQEGQRLLSLLDSSQYVQGFKPAFQSDIGTHFRHIFEHYRCFLQQVKEAEFRYDLRARDAQLETDIEYAKSSTEEIISLLENFDVDLFERDYKICESYGDLDDRHQLVSDVPTTLERELMFLQSHTVHHFAMIAAMTRSLGIQPDEEFGVAIPTRNYAKQLDRADISQKKKVGQ